MMASFWKKNRERGLEITRLNTDTGGKTCRHGQLCLRRYLGGAQDVEHQRQAYGDQLPAVVLLSDGGELSEQRQGDARPRLLLGTTQRFQPHMKLPWYALIKRAGGGGLKKQQKKTPFKRRRFLKSQENNPPLGFGLVPRARSSMVTSR